MEGVGDGVLALRLSGGGECYGEDACSIAPDDVLLPFLAAVVGLELDVGGVLSVDDEGKGKSVSGERMVRHEVDTDGGGVGTLRKGEAEGQLFMVCVQLFPF